MKISEHFTKEELSCRCCGLFLVPVDFVMWLEKVRAAYGLALPINRGMSCRRHNEKIGGSRNSAHLLGLAVDIPVPDNYYRLKLVKAALDCGALGVGIYKSHVHLDKKPRTFPVLWYGEYAKPKPKEPNKLKSV